MTTIGASIVWQQTAHERYDTDANKRAVAAIVALGLRVEHEQGGCALGTLDPLPADHGVYVKGTQEAVDGLRAALTPILGNPETISVHTYSVPA